MDKSIDGYQNTIYSLDDSYLSRGGSFPLLEVVKRYKGNRKKYFQKNEILIHQDWSTCDIFFKIDQYYLVFGFLDSEGNLKTHMCTATKDFDLESYEKKIDDYLK